MKIDEIIPYERNARNNAKAVPVVAESIKEFGLRGQIVLESRENPVIVTGHTRVAACKSLGWTDIPDERIDYADDLTDDQIKAYRLADNRTSEVATWNRSLLRSEVKAISKSSLDMSRFNFDFKSKTRSYGEERLRTDDYYNLRLVSAIHCSGEYDMPVIDGVDHKPDDLIGFNYAKTSSSFRSGVHFFIDDYQFERLWNKPDSYIELLKKFDCVLTPDFSMYLDMPLPMQQWSEYRRRALGNLWQRRGLKVIPTLSWGDERSYGFAFDGLPINSTVATSTIGVKNDERAMSVWRKGMTEAMSRLKPSRVLLYGGDVGFDFGDECEVVFYSNKVTERMARNGR